MSTYVSFANRRFNRPFYLKSRCVTSFLHIRSSNTVQASSTVFNKNEIPVKKFEELPSPPRVPIFGTMFNFMLKKGRRPFPKYILDMQFEGVKEYGKISKVHAPGFTTPIVQLADPSEAHKLFQLEPKYPRRIEMPVISNFLEGKKKTKGVFFADGHEWYRHRSVISKRILRPKELVSYSPMFNDVVSDFMVRFEKVKEENVGTEFENEVKNLNKELFKWSFESVCYFLFEKRLGCLADKTNENAQNLIHAVHGFLTSIFPVSLFPAPLYKYFKTTSYKRFIESFENMYKYAEIFIDEKIKDLEQQGKLSEENPKENLEDEGAGFFEFLIANGKLSREDITASVIDLMFAGIETTSNTILWALYMLGKNPEKQEVLYQEITSVLPPGELPSAETLANMPYVKAWIKETLRLYPVLPTLVRVLQEDQVLMGYHIPAGTHVNALYYYMSRDESSFKDATKFIPERWLRDSDNPWHTPGVPQSFASLPFGFGKRMCVGRRIAELEVHLLLTRIVRDYQVLYPHADDVEPEAQGAIVPDRPVRVKFIKRNTKNTSS